MNYNKMLKLLKYLLIICPGAIGFYGFMQITDITTSWALYYTIRLYSVNTDLQNINTWIEIARWTAPMATAGIFLIIFQTVKDSFIRLIKSLNRNNYTVYGDSQAAKYLLNDLGIHGIRGKENNITKTKNHIIYYDNENKNLEFYNKFYKRLKRYKVYINLDTIYPNSANTNILIPFSDIKNCAITYWSKYTALANEKIAIIGNNQLTNQLLEVALQVNIFSTSQCIEYYIYNKDNDFTYTHTELNKIEMDKLNFYQDDWYKHFKELSSMDRIILCNDNDEANLKILSRISESMIYNKIYINIKNSDIVKKYFLNEKIIPFGTLNELATKDIIVNEKLLSEAKALHNDYVKNNGGVQWDELSELLKESNLSSALYKNIMKMLVERGVTNDEMAELEHIRWCRFYYLKNFKYGEKKNAIQKTHPSLVPYEQLNDTEKTKDINNIKAI